MSLSKSKREKYHLDRKSKVDVIQAINEIGPKPGAKKWSSRELSDLLGQKLGRKISHTTVATLMKQASLINKQPEASDTSDRWRFKKNRQ